MEFNNGDIVSHTNSFNRFYVVKNNLKNGQYVVEDYEPNSQGIKEEYVFMAKYLLTRTGRRDYVLSDLLDSKLLDKKI